MSYARSRSTSSGDSLGSTPIWTKPTVRPAECRRSLSVLFKLFPETDRLHRYPRDHFRYIFVDEAHRSVEQAKAVTDYFHSAKVCGQTATAFRAKLKDLSAYYQTVAFELKLFSLIDQGYIVPFKVLTLPVEIDVSDVHQSQSFGGRITTRRSCTTSWRRTTGRSPS